MGISVLGATAPSDNWEQIAATNPAATTLNFTGISGYKKLMIFWSCATTPPSLSSFRFNSDSGTKYAYWSSSLTPTYTTSVTQTVLINDYMLLKLQSADNTNTKEYSLGTDISAGAAKHSADGIYQASAAITSVNIAWATAFNFTVYLYGVKS